MQFTQPLSHALTPAEREGVLRVANEPRHQVEGRGVVWQDYDCPSHIVWTVTEEAK